MLQHLDPMIIRAIRERDSTLPQISPDCFHAYSEAASKLHSKDIRIAICDFNASSGLEHFWTSGGRIYPTQSPYNDNGSAPLGQKPLAMKPIPDLSPEILANKKFFYLLDYGGPLRPNASWLVLKVPRSAINPLSQKLIISPYSLLDYSIDPLLFFEIETDFPDWEASPATLNYPRFCDKLRTMVTCCYFGRYSVENHHPTFTLMEPGPNAPHVFLRLDSQLRLNPLKSDETVFLYHHENNFIAPSGSKIFACFSMIKGPDSRSSNTWTDELRYAEYQFNLDRFVPDLDTRAHQNIFTRWLESHSESALETPQRSEELPWELEIKSYFATIPEVKVEFSWKEDCSESQHNLVALMRDVSQRIAHCSGITSLRTLHTTLTIVVTAGQYFTLTYQLEVNHPNLSPALNYYLSTTLGPKILLRQFRHSRDVVGGPSFTFSDFDALTNHLKYIRDIVSGLEHLKSISS